MKLREASFDLRNCLGIDPETEMRDSLNRPLPISRGAVLTDVLA